MNNLIPFGANSKTIISYINSMMEAKEVLNASLKNADLALLSFNDTLDEFRSYLILMTMEPPYDVDAKPQECQQEEEPEDPYLTHLRQEVDMMLEEIAAEERIMKLRPHINMALSKCPEKFNRKNLD